MIRTVVLLTMFLLPGAGFAAEADLAAGSIIKDCPACPELVVIPPGTFMMGTPADSKEVDIPRGEAPQVKITLPKKFAVARFELTHGQFREFVAATHYQIKPGCRIWNGKEFTDSPAASWEKPAQPDKPAADVPVACVSWNDAQAYLAWLSQKTGKAYRLPSVAEWEYAARAGSAASRFWGEDPDQACAWANVFDQDSRAKFAFTFANAQCKDGYADLAPVGKFKPNAFGLYDMIGNVWEWNADCFGGSHQGRPKDGHAWTWDAPCELHDIRGGGWMTQPNHNRVAWPGRDPPDQHSNFFGFRVARDLDATYAAPYGGAQMRRLTLYTGDIAKAKQFWVDGLGYVVRQDLPGFGGEVFAKTMHLLGDARAHFIILEPGKMDGPLLGLLGADGQTLPPLDRPDGAVPKSGDYIIVVKVADLAAVFAKLKAVGTTVLREPVKLPGTTGVQGSEASVLSPEGTHVLLQQIDAGG